MKKIFCILFIGIFIAILSNGIAHAACTCNVSPSGAEGATDADAIQACIDGFGSSGGQVVLTSGTFYIDSPITLKSNITIQGDGASSTTLNWTTDISDDWSYLFGYVNTASTDAISNITIKDLKIDGQDKWIIGVYFDGTSDDRIGQITVRDVDIVNCGEYGIHLKQTDGIFIRDAVLYNNGHYSGDPTGSGHNHNIYLRDVTQVFVEYVELTGAESNGMNLTNVTDAVVSYVTSDGNEGEGIRIASDDDDTTDTEEPHSERVRLSNCQTNNNDGNGLELQREDGSPHNIDICIEQATSTSNDQYGLLIRYTQAHELSGNTISGNIVDDIVYEYGASASDETSGICGDIPSNSGDWPFDRTGYSDPGTGSTDCDGDGYESTSDGGSDCNDDTLTGSDINRGVSEVCGDGIDQDCDGIDSSCDSDGDGIGDGSDNCSSTANADQANTDGDSQGDACDSDDDNDGYADAADCQPTNGGINPGVAEICGDTIDQNCDGTDPSCDTDGDGLSDSDEAALGTSPSDTDSDDDGLLDGDEVGRGTDPTDTDSDNDSISDYQEVQTGSDPTVYTDIITPILELLLSSDDDGDTYDSIDDGGDDCDDSDPLIYVGATETCGDGIDQDCSGSDTSCDTDGDGLNDTDEVTEGSDPNDPLSVACITPSTEDWTIISDCTFFSSKTWSENLYVQSGAVVTIPLGISLDLDFSQKKLVVESGSGVLIEQGGRIY